MRQAHGKGVLRNTTGRQRRIGPQPLGQCVHATESGGRRDAESKRVGHQFGQRARKTREGSQGAVREKLRLQGRAEQWIVLEEPVHVLQLRGADVLVTQARQPAQAAGFEIVRQRRGNVGRHAGSELDHAGQAADTDVRAKGIAMQAFELVQAHRLASLFARGPAHALRGVFGVGGNRDETGVKGGKRKELLRSGHKRLIGLGGSYGRDGAGRADGDKDLVAFQLGHKGEAYLSAPCISMDWQPTCDPGLR